MSDIGAEPGREPQTDEPSPTPAAFPAAVGDDAGDAGGVETAGVPANPVPDHLQRFATVDDAFAAIPTPHATVDQVITAYQERRNNQRQRLESWINGDR